MACCYLDTSSRAIFYSYLQSLESFNGRCYKQTSCCEKKFIFKIEMSYIYRWWYLASWVFLKADLKMGPQRFAHLIAFPTFKCSPNSYKVEICKKKQKNIRTPNQVLNILNSSLKMSFQMFNFQKKFLNLN
jgi:hypothetical protein